jgi:ABC-type uncharacterized transport system involved in gliding motility auxiliary subunit
MATTTDSSSANNPSKTGSSAAPAWLFSFIGAIIVFALLVTVNIIVTKLPGKLDLTEDKLHTLSDGTIEILEGLDAEVTLSFFASKDKDNMPPELTLYAKRVDALLDEYARKSQDDFLEIERVDPQPETDAEDRAKLNNLRGIPGRLGENAYLGITINCLDRKSSIPFVNPGNEQMLEYDISRAILEVSREGSPKVAVMSALPVTGGPPQAPFNPQARQQQQPPWQFYTALRRDYDSDLTDGESNLVDLGLDVEEIADDINVVVLVHPAGISENTQFALDQFLLRGGRIVAFLDAFSAVAAQSQPQQRQPFGGQQPGGIPTSSNLDKLLPAWGVNFESNQVIADRSYEESQGQARVNPTVMTITSAGIDSDDALTGSMRNLLMYMAGVFYVDSKEGIDVDTLVKSSKSSQLVVAQTAQFSPDQVVANFKASGKEYPLAVRLTGNFKTAFPEGKPKAAEEREEGGDEKTEPIEEWLKESQAEGSVFLVADSDMLFDDLSVARDMFGRATAYRNHNLPLLEGAVEQAAGGANLTSIRARGSGGRPFSKFKELRDEASKELNEEIKKVDDKASELTREISELMQKQGNNQMIVLSAEASDKIKELREQEVTAAKRKRELQRELRKDIRKIENRIKNYNIAGIPLLVAVIGILHLVVRRMKISAR